MGAGFSCPRLAADNHLKKEKCDSAARISHLQNKIGLPPRKLGALRGSSARGGHSVGAGFSCPRLAAATPRKKEKCDSAARISHLQNKIGLPPRKLGALRGSSARGGHSVGAGFSCPRLAAATPRKKEKCDSAARISHLQKILRGQDLNLRPSGYEPDELPGCSTPRSM